jgi:uncharacterized protein
VTVVSDSSPLIILAKIGNLELLRQLYQLVIVTPQVYDEIVVRGEGLTGSAEIAACSWINVQTIREDLETQRPQTDSGLGIGELSTIALAKEIAADLVLMDDSKARRTAVEQGLRIVGCVGVLEDACRSGLLSDLRHVYRQLLASGAYLDPRILESSLRSLHMEPL